jgi:hypothetical protein
VQGCGSGSGFSDFVDPNWESGSRGKKIKKFQWKNALFSYCLKKNLPLKSYKIALTTFWTKFWWITPWFFIWFDSNFDFKKIVFEISVLALIRIRIEQKCWIRIRIKSIRIHNPALVCTRYHLVRTHYMDHSSKNVYRYRYLQHMNVTPPI